MVNLEVTDTKITRRNFILDVLEQVGRGGAYPLELHRMWTNLCSQIGRRPGEYGSMRKAIYTMKRDGEIEEVPARDRPRGEIKSAEQIYDRVYYRLSGRRTK